MSAPEQHLRAAWDRYCERLKAAGDIVLGGAEELDELDLATGIQYLSRQVTKGLLLELEHKDARFPQLFTLQTPVSKNFGDNPDCTYLVAYLDGSETYRLTGTRGTVNWVRLSTRLLDPELGLNYVDDVPPGPTVAQEDLELDADGRFTVTIGPEPGEGAWLKTPPGPQQLFIRQFFGNWDTEEPMRLRLERVDAAGEVPEPVGAERIATALDEAARFVERDTTRWKNWFDFYRSSPNEFVSGRPDWAGISRAHERQGGRWLNFCAFDLEPGETLLVEFTPPECSMWIFELNNRWMNSVDYRHHFSSLNSVQAAVEEDGTVRIAVSDTDPGIPNWLDPAGHGEGLLINRWVDPIDGQDPRPATRLLRGDEAATVLAEGLQVTARERGEQLRRLRAGVDNRFQL